MDHKNSTQEMEFQFDKLNVSGYNCSRCNEPFTEELWCKDCDPFRIIEGWTSGNSNIDKFIKDTMYDARYGGKFLEWVPFDRFTKVKEIGGGGFAKVYSATWIDGPLRYRLEKQDDGSWKKSESEPTTIALKRLNESQNMTVEYLNEVRLLPFSEMLRFLNFHHLINRTHGNCRTHTEHNK